MLFTAIPAALWLLPPALGLLFLFRLLRARRRLLVAGSLLIWNRLAVLPVTARPKRIIFDLSLLLQTLTLTALLGALSRPTLLPKETGSRNILLVLDNGPLARARQINGTPAFSEVVERARTFLQRLNARDHVYIARSAPFPALLVPTALTPGEAADFCAKIIPALSGPDSASIRLHAAERVRTVGGGTAAFVVISLRDDPTPLENSQTTGLWLCAAGENQRARNTAVVDCGSLQLESKDGRRILARIANFSAEKCSGVVVLEALETSGARVLEERPLSIELGQETAAGFAISDELKSPLRLTWRDASKSADALPEDDSVVLAPQATHRPRIRFQASQPALEALFKHVFDAEIVSSASSDKESRDGNSALDLDIYIGSVPDRLSENVRAALFIAPERGYRSFYDVGDKTFRCNAVERGDEDPLNAEIQPGAYAAIPKYLEIRRTGDFKTLLRDPATSLPLAAKFRDEKARPCYLLAFSPGDGLPAERKLDFPLAVLFTRMLDEAMHAGPPYSRSAAAELEAAAGQPLPLDWRPAYDSKTQRGSGVLDEKASDTRTTARRKPGGEPAINTLLSARSSQSANAIELAPWLILIGLLLAAFEFYKSQE